ncbi:MAG: F0F1 ATP synthase subunit A [Chloroflexi bacterium]|nr:F0F1 ATP synthase subunit A [Chloroflexota bacterium]
MSRRYLWLQIIVAVVIIIVASRLLFPVGTPTLSVRGEPIPGWFLNLGFTSIPITNSLLATWVTMVVLVILAFLTTRNVSLIPGRLQNIMELAVEAIYNLVLDGVGPKWVSRIFPLVATMFFLILLSNLISVAVPVISAIGFKEVHDGKEILIPILRSPSADLNFTVGLALTSVILTQVYGVMANGFFPYFNRFFQVGAIIEVIKGKKGPGMAGLDIFVGLIEFVSELAKIISFSFRLFGNIFAGEVLLLIVASFVSLGLPLIFLGFETFIAFIQAFVFAVLTMSFMSLAIAGEHEEEVEGH